VKPSTMHQVCMLCTAGPVGSHHHLLVEHAGNTVRANYVYYCCTALPSGHLVAAASGPLVAAAAVSGASEATPIGVETAAGLDAPQLCKFLLLLPGDAVVTVEAGPILCGRTFTIQHSALGAASILGLIHVGM
jgi:hypothetical protein